MTPAKPPNADDAPPQKPPGRPRRPRKHRSFLRALLRYVIIFVVAIICLVAIARPFLPWAVRSYVNRTLDRSKVYNGKIGDVHLHLWRGAYSIDDIRLVKKTGDVPVPLFAAKRLDLAVEWKAILHHKLVGTIVMVQPELNFVDAPDPADSQTGAGGPWLQIIRDLFPFKINSVQILDGSIHFRAYQARQPVDVYLSQLRATVNDLTNVRNTITPLVTSIDAHALAMDQAKFEFHMKLDPFSYRPTFHLTARLLGLDVTQINTLALAYGKFDFKRGWFDLVVDVGSKEGQFTGYVKPLFRDLKVFSLIKDVKEDNPLQFFWQAVVGVATGLLKNQPRDQLGTLIPFTGNADTTRPDILATIGNLLQNAFIRAYLPRLERTNSDDQGLQFGAPSISDPVAPVN